MEQAVGIACAAATRSQFLDEGYLDWKRDRQQESSESAWAEVWVALKKLGLRPTDDTTKASVVTQASASTRASASAPAATRAEAPDPAPALPPFRGFGAMRSAIGHSDRERKGLTYVRGPTYVRACLCYCLSFLEHTEDVRRTRRRTRLYDFRQGPDFRQGKDFRTPPPLSPGSSPAPS